jgi:oligopeptide/dipeptide ABC transporter ATP-binding protein
MSAPLLEASGLSRTFVARGGLLGLFGRGGGSVRAVDDVSFSIGRGEVLALVGESGSGKTTTGRIVTLQERADTGALRFGGVAVGALSGAALKAYRRRVQMIFQNPFEALDPRHAVLAAVTEPLAIHGIATRAERGARAEAALEAVELRPANRFAARYPADLSGGQLQRVAIARTLVLEPELIVADEPVSMLDVSVRSGVMTLMLGLRERLGVGFLYITHDLAVARYMSERIAVMYLGRIVEYGPTEALLAAAGHPYTRLLRAAVPEHRAGARRARVRLAGDAASVAALPSGCRFHPRCPRAEALCRAEEPPLAALAPGHAAACHFAPEVAARGLAALSGGSAA